MRKNRKFMAIVAIITLFTFSYYTNATAGGWTMSARIALSRAMAAQGGFGAMGPVAAAASGITLPAWAPWAAGAAIVTAVAAGLYFMYRTDQDKKVSPSGSIDLPGASVQWVDIQNGVPMVGTATGTDAQITPGNLKNKVFANPSKYPALHAALEDSEKQLTAESGVGDIGFGPDGKTYQVNGTTNYGCGSGPSEFSWYSPGVILAAPASFVDCSHYPGLVGYVKLAVSGATFTGAPVPNNQVQGRLTDAACAKGGVGETSICAGNEVLKLGLGGEIDSLAHDEPNVVQYMPALDNMVAASQSAIDAANANLEKANQTATVTAANSAVDAAQDAVNTAQSNYNSALSNQSSACAGSGSGSAACIAATSAVQSASNSLSGAKTNLANAQTAAANATQTALNDAGAGGSTPKNVDDTGSSYPSVGNETAKTLDFAPLKKLQGSLSNVWPFNLLGAIGDTLGGLVGTPTAPVFDLPLPFNLSIRVDLTPFDPLAAICRWIMGIFYSIGVALGINKFWRGVS